MHRRQKEITAKELRRGKKENEERALDQAQRMAQQQRLNSRISPTPPVTYAPPQIPPNPYAAAAQPAASRAPSAGAVPTGSGGGGSKYAVTLPSQESVHEAKVRH